MWVEPELREVAGAGGAGTGTGLRNVRQRLEAAHPDKHSLNVSQREGRVVVTLQINGVPRQ